MTRNFRDEWEASAHADDKPVASAEVQQRSLPCCGRRPPVTLPACPTTSPRACATR